MARGDGPPVRVRWLIAAGCLLTLLLVREGLTSLWDIAAFASPVGEWWFCNALPAFLAAALLAVCLVPSSISRWLRVAVAVPVLHVIAIAGVAVLWFALDRAMAEEGSWAFSVRRPPVPSLYTVVLTAAIPLLVGLLVDHRRGEWAHAAVMFALAYVLVLGLWMPVVCWDWLEVKWQMVAEYSFDNYWGRYYLFEHRVDTPYFLGVVTLPPLLAATAYTWFAFHRRAAFARWQAASTIVVRVLFALAVIATVTMRDANALLYLSFSYVLLIAVVLAATSLAAVTLVTYVRTAAIYFRMSRLRWVAGTVVSGEAHASVTTMLRGPRVDATPLVVATEHGDVPVRTAELLAPAEATIRGDARVVGERDRVLLGVAKMTDGGDPFRSALVGDVELVVAPGAERYRFSDALLVMWRPAVAYLAILCAIAVPAVVMIVS